MSKFFKGIIALTVWLGVVGGVQAEPLVTTQWVADNLNNPKVVLIDLRNKIDGGSYETYVQGHIPSSLHSDYLQDGWRVGRDGVVGLLPTANQFETLARGLGVNKDSHVVVIPAGVSSTDFGSSARAYWTFKVFGHDNVSILDGGYTAWQQAFPNRIETGAPRTITPGNFVATFQPALYASTAQVSDAVGREDVVLLDGRTTEQYNGDAKHPRAKTAGHIPGAVLLSQAEGYNPSTNRLKTATELSTLYGNVVGDKAVVSYCNTGHWASTNWFILSEVLGRNNVKLYDGSMVAWTDDIENIVAVPSNFEKLKSKVKSVLK